VTAEEIDPALTFAALWSNPPIRIGKQALHELLETWLPRLEPGAKAHLVVQKHLGSDSLQRWLTASGRPTTRLASRSSYRILEVQTRVHP
jgi:16S rRNA (guanine1207-N2)-methyltransferase